jgi:FixJ family two-component response regulator
VEALNTTTIRRLTSSSRHQLLAIAPGISLVLYLKEVGLPVVVISGIPEAMARAVEDDLQLLRKPFRAKELYDAINVALSGGSSDGETTDRPG